MLVRVGLLVIGLMGGLLTALASPAQAAEDNKCLVTVNRDYANDTYEVTRQVLANGDCVCYIQTGREPQSTDIERKIVNLRRERECAAATVMAVPAGHSVAATSTVGKFTVLPFAAAAAAAAAIAAGSGNGNPASP